MERSPPGRHRTDGPARCWPSGSPWASRAEAPGDRGTVRQAVRAGEFKDAYEGYRRLALDPKAEPDRVGDDLRRAIECLVQLGPRR